LRVNEAREIIKSYGYTNEEEIKALIAITNRVPYFLNMLSKLKGNNISEKLVDLRSKIIEKLKPRAESFFDNYYKKNLDYQQIFKRIIYHLNSPTEYFLFDEIKDIMDYQLLDLELFNPSETKDIPKDSNDIRIKNKVFIDLYDYLEKNPENTKNSMRFDIIPFSLLLQNKLLKVRVKTKYPMIFQIYQDVFKERNDYVAIPDLLTTAIIDYINNYYDDELQKYMDEDEIKEFQQNSVKDKNMTAKTSDSLDIPEYYYNVSGRKQGFLFEELLNIHISENKKTNNILYPPELGFFEKWENRKYYDAIEINKQNAKFVSESYEGLAKFYPSIFYRNYPPLKIDLLYDLLYGLYFTNFTQNHPSIDGGFMFINDYKDNSDSGNENQEFVLDIITYDVTVGDKVKIFKKKKGKIDELIFNLKKIYENIVTTSLMRTNIKKENFIKHYFIILENAGNYEKN